MKRFALTMSLVFAGAGLFAQSYIIGFAGTGANNVVDSVIVENITQNKTVKFGGGDLLNLGTAVGVQDLELRKDKLLNIFPNPFTEFVNVECDLIDAGNVTIEIIDISGREIIRTQRNLVQGRYSFRINGLNKGIYFIHINSEKYSYAGKIISNSDVAGIPAISVLNQGSGRANGSHFKSAVSELVVDTKSTASLIQMQYNAGDLLRITGISGIHRTVFMLQPENDQTVTFNFVACADAGGNSYTTVNIGTQVWMAENLKATKYADGTDISPSLMAVCNDDSSTVNKLGYLYTWNALMNNSVVAGSQGACPDGWHVPTVSDYNVLINFLGGPGVAGQKMKSTDATYWDNISLNDNSSGFNALGAGYKLQSMVFYYKAQAKYWTSNEEGNNGREVQLQSNTAGLWNMYGSSKTALKASCRCLKN
jgi:uncharacterized protein (TIGR02145 family)